MTINRIDAHSWKHWTGLLIGFLMITVGSLWSFNTVAELVGAPTAQYKHALAALTLLLIAGWILRAPGHLRVGHSEQSG